MKPILPIKRKLTGCDVEGCLNRDGLERVKLKRFDPIDHEPLHHFLCPEHQEWAAERNAVVEVFHDELREARKQIGQEHVEIVQQYAMPQDGKLREDILMGDPDEDFIHLNDMFEESKEIALKPGFIDRLNESTSDDVVVGSDDVEVVDGSDTDSDAA